MFKKIIIALVVLVAAVLAYAATRPDSFRLERSTSINAPPEKIFPYINDLHSHRSWSPWERKDSAMKRVYSGAELGKGAVYEWDGNKNIGKGLTFELVIVFSLMVWVLNWALVKINQTKTPCSII